MTPTVIEEWRPCPGWSRYEVSSWGRIRNRLKGRILAKFVNCRTGRLFVSIYSDARKLKSQRSAPLIAAAFVGPRPPGKQIDHINGNKWDERAENLQFVTQSENVQRSYDLGLHPVRSSKAGWLGEKGHDQIRALAREGWSQVQIARLLGCNNSSVSKILSGKIGGFRTGLFAKAPAVVVSCST